MFILGNCRARVKTLGFFCALVLASVAAGGVCVVRGQSSTFVEIPGTQWAARFNGPANHDDRRPLMALDAHGNVYVAAETQSLTPAPAFGLEGNNTDIVTIKYDPSGNQLWAATFNGPGQYVDSPKDSGVDAQGNVFVTGYSWRGRQSEGGTDYDFVTLKYDAGGSQRWVRYYSGPQSPVRSVMSAADGRYTLTAIPAGITYVLRPSKVGATFNPASRTYANLSANQSPGQYTNFTGP